MLQNCNDGSCYKLWIRVPKNTGFPTNPHLPGTKINPAKGVKNIHQKNIETD